MGDYTQVPTPPADSVATASAQPDSPVPDPNRPLSTIPADSPPASPSSQPKPADSVDQVFEATASAEIIPPADLQTPIPAASPSSSSADPSPVVPSAPVVPEVPAQIVPPTQAESQPPSVSMPSETPKQSDIQDHSPSNQPSQVQPEAPQNTPVVRVENVPSQSAGIKPEPPQGTQNAPSADVKLSETPKTSFGDLMGTPADLSEEPAIHIDPIEAPTTPPVPNEKEVSALHRQRAVEARKQKREENLVKILELAQKKGKVDNLDVRDFLHISQTTATDYLHTLVNSGKLKKEGKAKATKYSL